MSVFSDFNKSLKKSMGKSNDDIVFESKNAEPIGTGSVIVDEMVGSLAYLGRLTEINSYESGGKTTLSLLTCAQALKKYPDKGILYLDAELALDASYMKTLGVDPDDERVMIYQPNNIEEASKILSLGFDDKKGKKGELVGKISLIVIDSVATLRPKTELEGEMGESSQKAQHASAWAVFSPKLNQVAKKANLAILMVNQFRHKPSLSNMDKFSLNSTGLGQGYSNTDTAINTTGGTALKYYLSARFLTRFVSTLKEQVEDDITGEVTEERVSNVFKLVNFKNKVSDPYKSTKFVIEFGKGIDDYPMIYEVLKNKGIIGNNGSFMTYKSSSGEIVKVLGKMGFNKELRSTWFDDMKKQFMDIDTSDLEDEEIYEESELDSQSSKEVIL